MSFSLLISLGIVIIFARLRGGIAQLVERLVRNEKVRGSNPLTSKTKGAEVTATIRVHYWIASGSVMPLPPVFARSGSGERRLSHRTLSDGVLLSPGNVM